MAPKTKAPKLREMNARRLAHEVAVSAEKRVREAAAIVGLECVPATEPKASQLAAAVELLTVFALTGQDLAKAKEAYDLIDRILYRRLVDGDAVGVRGDWKTPLGLVLAAASGRIRISQGKPVRADELAALTGFSVERVRQEIRMGRMKRAATPPPGRRLIDAEILASTAKTWLARRKVVGFVTA
ncbi:MAG: hypothetical protein HOW73_43430 [Polyangiaceae bacterium]|nr:hypothetical protein [Polyangiaceae bacterium]